MMLSMTPMIADQQEERIAAGGAPLRRTVEFEELFRELVGEAGRALEEGNLGWWAVLQEVLIPQIDAEIQSVSIYSGLQTSAQKPPHANLLAGYYA